MTTVGFQGFMDMIANESTTVVCLPLNAVLLQNGFHRQHTWSGELFTGASFVDLLLNISKLIPGAAARLQLQFG